MKAGAKKEILSRIDRALGTGSREPAPIPRKYRTAGGRDRQGTLDLFVDRVSDYRASVVRVSEADLPGEVARALVQLPSRRLAVPGDLPDSWLAEVAPGELEILRDGAGYQGSTLSTGQLASCYGVVTGSALAIAETGTIILDGGPGQGRRALSLLPDYHLCVVFSAQVLETVPEAIRIMESGIKAGRRPFTLISGPSATSDIELVRVEGVHGPRNLRVILVERE